MFFSKKADGEIHWPFLFLTEQVRMYHAIQTGNIISAQPLGFPFQKMTKYIIENSAMLVVLHIYSRVQS